MSVSIQVEVCFSGSSVFFHILRQNCFICAGVPFFGKHPTSSDRGIQLSTRRSRAASGYDGAALGLAEDGAEVSLA